MRVLIVDDHELVWGGIRNVVTRFLEQRMRDEPADVVCVRDVTSALATKGEPFDLILLDYHLPDFSGLEAMDALRQRFDAAPIVIVSGDEKPANIRGAIKAGAAGYIPKKVSEPEMVAALGLVLAHGIYLPPIALLDADPPAAENLRVDNDALGSFIAAELSPRQREVFARALRGMPNKVIARELGIAEGTVKVHLAMVYRALGVANRTEAMCRVLSADAAAALGRM
jgi:two-component system nitrate/nitrite response regulator NarL